MRTLSGEHALGILLSLSNNICKSHQEVINYIWDRKETVVLKLVVKRLGL